MLPPSTRLGPVSLQIADLARSISFYERVLGMRVISRDDASATLGAHGDAEPLVHLVEKADVRPVPRGGLLGLYHFAILLPDRESLGRFLDHATNLGVRLGMADHLVSEALYLHDPDNLGIEVYADRPRDTWRVVGGELAMASDPLDVASLRRPAGEWKLPSGTRMGHVHLHVGDLVAAGKFYSEAVGLTPTVTRYPGALFLAAGGYHHHLGTNTWARSAQSAGDNDARLLSWSILLPDESEVEFAARRIAAAGNAITEGEHDARVADPWGTLVSFSATSALK